jgi:hypothetical protein
MKAFFNTLDRFGTLRRSEHPSSRQGWVASIDEASVV